MTKSKTAVFINHDPELFSRVAAALGDRLRLVVYADMQTSLDYIYSSLPDLIIVDARDLGPLSARLLAEFKEDPIFGQFPVLGLVGDGQCAEWECASFDDCMRVSHIDADLPHRAGLCLRRAERIVAVSPLTQLPGNISITRQIQRRLDDGVVFGIAYADLDHFKPFNDRYGFSRGDEVLKMTGRLLMNVVRARQRQDSFAGHIGGDDFVFIMSPDLIEETAAELIGHFDDIVPTFYDPDSRAVRAIESVDREGNRRTFPIISMSIGIATNVLRRYSHYGEMTGVAAEMKSYAKRFKGSCYRLDRRTAPCAS